MTTIQRFQQTIENKIYLMRGLKVILSFDLAELYDVEVKALIQAVKRNKSRFPADFMFQLTWEEVRFLRSQNVTLKTTGVTKDPRGTHVKFRPYAFTEQGVAMLSSVLRSRRAIQVNIAIMRVFVKLREFLIARKELSLRLADLEKKYEKHDSEIQSVFEAIRQLMNPPSEPESPKRKIGFHSE